MGKKLLLADNSATIQKLVEMALADTDYELETVGDGADALKVLETFRPDIVLAASIMPMMDGYRLCEEIKKHPDFQNIPVILSTSRFRPYDQERADQVGVAARLVKPFSQELLLEALEQMLPDDLDEPDENDLLPEVSDEILEAEVEHDEPMELDEADVHEEESEGDLATVAMTPDQLKSEMEPPAVEDLPGPAEDMLLEDDDEPSFDDVQFDDDEADVANQVSEAFAAADTEPVAIESDRGDTLELQTTDLEELDELDENDLEDLDEDALEELDTSLEDDDDAVEAFDTNLDDNAADTLEALDETELEADTADPFTDNEAASDDDELDATIADTDLNDLDEADDPNAEPIEMESVPNEQLDEVSFDMAEEDAIPMASDEVFDMDAPDSLDQVNLDDDEALDLENVSFDTGETEIESSMDTAPMLEEAAQAAGGISTEESELDSSDLNEDTPTLDEIEADAADQFAEMATGDSEAETFAAEPESFDAESPLDVETETTDFEEFDQPLLEDEAETVVTEELDGFSEVEPYQADNDDFDPAANYDSNNDVSLDEVPLEEHEEPAEQDHSTEQEAELETAGEEDEVEDDALEMPAVAAENAQPPAAVDAMSATIAETVESDPVATTLNDDQMDELAERVAEKVIARLSSDTIRDIAWEVVPELAEAMIKRRIYELEQSAEDA